MVESAHSPVEKPCCSNHGCSGPSNVLARNVEGVSANPCHPISFLWTPPATPATGSEITCGACSVDHGLWKAHDVPGVAVQHNSLPFPWNIVIASDICRLKLVGHRSVSWEYIISIPDACPTSSLFDRKRSCHSQSQSQTLYC